MMDQLYARSSPLPALGLHLPNVPLGAIRHVSPHVFQSDHAPFGEVGLPALMWTDTAEFRNPLYHQPTDTPATLDDFMVNVTGLLFHVVLSGISRPEQC